MTKKSEIGKFKSRIRSPKSPSGPSSYTEKPSITGKKERDNEITAALRAEVEELRARLAETEEALTAIRIEHAKPVADRRAGDRAFEAAESFIVGDTMSETQLAERNSELLLHQVELQVQNEELREAYAELERSRRKFFDLYDFAPVGYYTLDANGLIKDINKTAVKQLRTDKQSLLNKPFALLVAEDEDKRLFSAHQRQTFSSQERCTCDIKILRKDATFFYAHLESIGLENADGRAAHIRMTVTDMTERKRTEESVQQSNRLLDGILNNTHLLIACLDTNFNFIWVNRAYAEADGKMPDFFPGKNHFELYPNDENLAIFRNTVQTGEPFLIQAKPFEYKDDPERGVTYWDWGLNPIVDHATGKVERLVFTLLDITARKRAEEALQESEERFRNIFSQSPIGIGVYDAEGKLVQLNRSAMDMFGLSKVEELLGLRLFDSPTITKEKKAALMRGAPVQEEVVYDFETIKALRFYKTGKTGFAYLNRLITPLKTELQNKPAGYLVQIQDITERKRYESKIMQQNTVLEEINRIFQETIDCETEEELGKICLAAALRLTKSGFGFIGEIGRDGVFHDIANSNPALNNCKVYNQPAYDQQSGGRTMHGFCNRVMEEGKAFLTNYPDSHTESRGLIPGQESFSSFLGVPLIQAGKTIGMVGLGNRDGGYRTEDRDSMEALAAAIVQLFLRRKAEEALLKNQERMREYVKLLEYAPLMVRNRKEEIILWNKGMERIYGYSSAEAIGRKSCELLKTSFTQSAQEIMRAVESTGKWEGELKQVTRTGNNVIVSSLWILYKNEAGKDVAVIEVNNDVTALRVAEEAVRKLNEELESRVRERTTDLARTITALQCEVAYRRKAEEALRESQFNLSKAQSLAHIGSWSYDVQSDKFVSSEEFYNIFGMKRLADHIDLRALENIIHPEDRDKVRERIGELMSNGTVKPMDYRIIQPGGDSRVVWTEAEMVRDVEGRPASVIGTVHDITERKRAEEELTRLATAIQSAADALVVTEPVNGIIQYVNPAFEKITGYSRAEAFGRDLHMLDSGRHDDAFYRDLRESLQRDGFWNGRLIQKRKDGTLYEEECTYSLVKNSSGDVINYIAIKRDVTEKARLESIAQAVDSMNNIGYIFAGVSHEIGNPVSAMGMTLDIMTRKIDSLRDEKMKQYVHHLAAQVRSIEYLLKTLKSFNMYESLDLKRLDISPFFESFLSMVKKDFQAKGIAINCVIEPEAKFLYADPRALQQVLLNILTNAADALAGREQPGIHILVSESAGKIRLRIEDNGKGIEETRLNQLFKPFYTTKAHGTGLGLVIIRKMIAKMRGTVEITSSVNVGTVVLLQIPSKEN